MDLRGATAETQQLVYGEQIGWINPSVTKEPDNLAFLRQVVQLRAKLIDYFVDEYAVARTPNPCILCNRWFKFGKLASYADAIGVDFIATGHYARIAVVDDRVILRRARFLNKDQSYVLFGVDPAILRRTQFPLGEMTKDEVRDHAKRFGLALHDKRESQDICFVSDRDYEQLVRHRRPEAEELPCNDAGGWRWPHTPGWR